VVPVAIALVFLLLMSTFGSLRQAAIVLANIPFALSGGVYALYLSGEYLSVPASVGFIALLGIAVLNGVVMVSYFNQLAARGQCCTPRMSGCWPARFRAAHTNLRASAAHLLGCK
jgi:cobalt-zinc-cadmium resistance protein CzcA